MKKLYTGPISDVRVAAFLVMWVTMTNIGGRREVENAGRSPGRHS